MKALRSARELVRYRRWTILRKVLFLPLLLLIVTAIMMVPVISVVTPLAQWVFFILMMAAIAVVHSYMYTLYRELLHE
jgi:phosphatidylglycerophosphate synthase